MTSPALPSISTRTDQELVQLAQEGHEDAFTELMRRSSSVSFKMAVRILRDQHEAEDELQNAYWKAWQHIGQFHSDAKFSTWMTRIVVNQCLMRLRQGRRANFLYLDDVQVGEERRTMDLADARPTPEDELGNQETAALVRREVRRLPPLLRDVLILRELEGLSMEELAERLSISVPAAKSRLLRARGELRNRFLKHCGEDGVQTLCA